MVYFLKNSRTNWKYILIVALFTFIVSGGILGYQYFYLPRQEVEISKPEILEKEIPQKEQVTEAPREEIYEPKEFIAASWGKEEKQVGLVYVQKHNFWFGPSAFDIGEDNHLYLMDWLNGRIIHYDENGEYIESFEASGRNNLRIKDNFVYTLNLAQFRIYKYKTSGEFLKGYSLMDEIGNIKGPPADDLGGNKKIDFDNEGNLMIAYGEKWEVGGEEKYVYRYYQVEGGGENWEENSYTGFRSRDGENYYLITGKTIQVLNKTGNLKREIEIEGIEVDLESIKHKSPKSAFVDFVDTDRQGNIYLSIEFRFGAKGEYIWKYNREGNRIAVLDLLEPLTPSIGKPGYAGSFIWISSKGDIYKMFTFEEGMKIFKYTRVETRL